MAQGQLIATLDCNTQEIILDVQGGSASGDFEVMFPDATTQTISGSLPLTVTSPFSGIHVFWNTSLDPAASSVSSVLPVSIDVDYVNCSQLSEDGEANLYCLFNLNNAYEKALCKNEKLAEVEKQKLDRAIQLIVLMKHITECSDNQSGCNVYGCTDDSMFNYNPNACMDDGSCYPIIYGCLNPSASNYITPVGNPLVDANTDDGSCTNIPNSWDCVNGNCQDPGTGNGQFSSLAACQAVCGVVTPSWNCVNGNCIDPNTGNGTYSTLAACQAACQIPSSFDCISGNCIDPGTGNGAYFTLAACQAACNASPCGGSTTPCVPNTTSGACVGTVSVPNYNFEMSLAFMQLDDFNFPNQLTNASTVCTVTSLNINITQVVALSGGQNNPVSGNISNFTGLEAFVSLENLSVAGHNITTFVNNNSLSFAPCLRELNVGTTNLDISTLDLSSNNNLETVWFSGATGNTGQMPISSTNHPKLKIIKAIGLNMNSSIYPNGLDLSSFSCLKEVYINNTGLNGYNLTGLTNLEKLWISDNLETTIDVSTCIALTEFLLNGNFNITSVNLGSNIDLANLNLSTFNSNCAMLIHVGTAARVAQANTLFPAACGTFTDAAY